MSGNVRCAMCDVRCRAACGLAMLLLVLFAGGCQSYALRGRVVEGTRSQVLLVDADDPRLTGPGAPAGIDGAGISFMLDPEKAGHKSLGGTICDADGSFRYPVDEIGAGLLEYGLGVTARAPGKSPAQDSMPMPPGDKRLLIMLAPGRDNLPRESGNPMNDIERYMPR
ncbi:MAG: hypothetical protein ACYC26_00555 [Phycisphaerales bacterium]